MGKLAKQRRYQKRRDRLHIAQLEGALASQREKLNQLDSVHRWTLQRQAEETQHKHNAEERLAGIVRILERIASANVCLPAETKITRNITRCWAPTDHRYAISEAEAHAIRTRTHMEIMHVLMTDMELRQDLQRCLHFRVVNAPGDKSFTFGYAVSHRVIELMRQPEDMVEMITREFGHAIYKELMK